MKYFEIKLEGSEKVIHLNELPREDDKPIWNIRLIDETHPKWDSKFSKHGQTMYGMVNMLAKMFK